MTSLHEDAVAVLRGWSAPSVSQGLLQSLYVAHLSMCADGTSRSCEPDHLTAGVLVLSADREQVLLTLHAKARRWFHLGGHLEPGDSTLTGGALREGIEESGIPGLVLDPSPLHLDAHVVDFCGGRPAIRHLDVRFLALAPEGATPVVSEESVDVRWWPVGELPTPEPGMRELVDVALVRSRSARAADSLRPQ